MTKISRATLQYLRAIQIFADDGRRAPEIASALGITQSRVRRLCRRFGIRLGRGGQRRFALHVPERHWNVISGLADGARIPPAEMAARMLATVAGDGSEHAARRLGKAALPKRGRT